MANERHYERAFHTLGAPAETLHLVNHAKFLFAAADFGYKLDNALPIPGRPLEDDVNASHAHWEWHGDTSDEYERLGVTLVSSALILALEHRHEDMQFAEARRRTSIVVHAQKVALHTSDRGSPRYIETPRDWDVVEGFTSQLEHTMAQIGLNQWAELSSDNQAAQSLSASA